MVEIILDFVSNETYRVLNRIIVIKSINLIGRLSKSGKADSADVIEGSDFEFVG